MMPLMRPDINEEMPGTFTVEFVTGHMALLHCKRVVVDSRGHPIWLDLVGGSRYNFQLILSITKER